ncbi:hypothetical protein [Halalkalibacter wakoensis]|uniref:hypothetical protein n=1 Tax=Halalkalibacter wakoensis TaxID=127891 RepID=UPI00054F4E75|nr:hypothetical protein [Halalkalibacter wakoensis]
MELQPIAGYLKNTIDVFFEHQDFSIYIPGRHVLIKNLPDDLRMVLVSAGKSDPYKVFYPITGGSVEIFLIRHPHQKPI